MNNTYTHKWSLCHTDNRSSWFVSAHGDGEERLLPLLDGSPSKNKDIAVHKCVLTAHKGQKCLQLLIF